MYSPQHQLVGGGSPLSISLTLIFQGTIPVSVHNISLSLIDDLDTWTYRGECDRGYPK